MNKIHRWVSGMLIIGLLVSALSGCAALEALKALQGGDDENGTTQTDKDKLPDGSRDPSGSRTPSGGKQPGGGRDPSGNRRGSRNDGMGRLGQGPGAARDAGCAVLLPSAGSVRGAFMRGRNRDDLSLDACLEAGQDMPHRSRPGKWRKKPDKEKRVPPSGSAVRDRRRAGGKCAESPEKIPAHRVVFTDLFLSGVWVYALLLFHQQPQYADFLF